MSQSKCPHSSSEAQLPQSVPPSKLCLIASLRSPTNFFAKHPIFFSTPPSSKRRNPFTDFAQQPIAKRIRLDISSCDPINASSQPAPNATRKAISMGDHRDLNSKTAVELQNLLAINLENGRKNDVSIANWNERDTEDIVVLTGLKNLYTERTSAITVAITTASSVAISDAPLWIPPTEEEAEDVGLTRTNAKYTEILRRRFGIRSFRKNQLESLKNIVEGRRDTFVLMPTGAGKSLCYQIPAVIENEESDSVTVVVSPLCSLIDDQVTALAAKGVDAIGLAADTDMRILTKRLVDGQPNPALIYCTPEKIQKNSWLRDTLLDLHGKKKLAMFAIDEAHCIPLWGQEFRPAYLELSTLRDVFPGVPIMALTSTATSQTIDKINLSLKLQNTSVIRQSVNRPNLTYLVKQKRNKIDDLVDFIQRDHTNQSGIIYRTGQKQCEQLAEILNKRGISAKAYHASLADKRNIQTEWQNGGFHVIVATVAFGLGIDKADVRFVVHYNLPSSLENYFQETGRAGRDGEPADCCLYYTFRDKKTILDLGLSASTRKTEDNYAQSFDGIHQRASEIVEYCENKRDCRRVLLLRYFGEAFDKTNCGNTCDNCANTHLLVSEDLSKEAALAVALLRNFEHQRITALQYVEIFRGADTKKTRENGRNRSAYFGAGRKLSLDQAKLLFDNLLYQGVFVEHKVHTGGDNYSYYLKVRPNAENEPKATITYHKSKQYSL
ncbi:P-loop containing nucleoside triphosphate hydrolase protein [Mycena sanguinolenta]|nr:P-loop containing nucleoside triphosphate hydrolase protein [Mycena sanguinolenta]